MLFRQQIFYKQFGIYKVNFCKVRTKLHSNQHLFTGPETPWDWKGHAPPHPSPYFCVTNGKKRNKEKKELVSKQKHLKGCHQGQNVTVLLTKFFMPLNHGGRQYFSLFHGPSTLKSILPALCKIMIHLFFFISMWENSLQP